MLAQNTAGALFVEAVPFPLRVAGAVLCLALWVAAYGVRPRGGFTWPRAALGALRIAVGAAGLLLALDAGRQWLLPATDWPLWLPAVAAALAVELVSATYELERGTVGRRAGRALVALRLLLALGVALMLAQPVLRRGIERSARRTVVLLLDQSASMRVPDNGMPPAERLRLAEFFWPQAFPCPHEMEGAAATLGALGRKLSARVEWLDLLMELAPEARSARLASEHAGLLDELQAAAESVTEQVDHIDRALAAFGNLPQDASDSLAQLRETLADRAGPSLAEAAGLLDDAGQIERLRSLLQAAGEAAAEAQPIAARASAALDEAWYGSLPDDRRSQVDALAAVHRLDTASRVLYGAPDRADGTQPWSGLAGELLDSYAVKAYGFASEPEELAAGAGPESSQEEADASDMETNLAAALAAAAADVPVERDAGIVVLTDGRHNARALVKPVAARLGMAGVPVSTVLIGAAQPPTDAAVTSIEAPNAVYAGDRVHVSAEVKLDGMAGRTVQVMLVDADTVVDSQAIAPDGERFRTTVDLDADPPGAGVHSYRVRIAPSEDEVLAGNNEYPLSVSVTDDQVRLLLVEGRPRWEYRYLKNLFAQRDKTVRLQQVLMHPEHIEGQAPPHIVRASTDRPPGETEATALPETEDDWLKFDVVILGDLTPAELPVAAQEALRRFVVDRAGTLVVIAGRRAMPQEFAGTPLGDLLPVESVGAAADESEYHVALTPEGRRSIMLRLKPGEAQNAEFWSSRPSIYWRAPVAATRPNASVLAFAQPQSVPAEQRASDHAGSSPEDRSYQRAHPLIVTQQAGLGRVVFLAFDSTWRLRHREGDTYHHRFWGQLLRWATGGALPAGTALVKLGTDQERYALTESVTVRARLLEPDLSPLLTNEAAVAVRRDGGLVLRRRLDYIGDLPGMYAAEIGQLAPGTYTVELEGPEVEAALAAEGSTGVSTSFSVDPAASTEQVELSADSGLPGIVAQMTGGVVVPAWQAPAVVAALRPAEYTVQERADYDLWDSWPWLAALLGLATAEWVLRKRVGLP